MKRWVAEAIAEQTYGSIAVIDYIGRNGAEFAVTFNGIGDLLSGVSLAGSLAEKMAQDGDDSRIEFAHEVRNILLDKTGKVAF